MKKLLLTENWQFKLRDPANEVGADFARPENWSPATIPGSVHQDLLAIGAIPDPFYGLNEREVQWVGESDWLYRCNFDLPADFSGNGSTSLCFDGLDTYATVWLNGERLLKSDNMFVPYRLEVSKLLEPTGNELQILFESAFLCGEAQEAELGKLTAWNGATSRLYVRKAQYHYGWDWGPTLLTAGIWRGVRLETFNARIAEVDCPVEVEEDLSRATLTARLQIETTGVAPASDLFVILKLYTPTGNILAEQKVPVENGAASHIFEISSPELWWPNGYGSQPLYSLEVSLQTSNIELDHSEKRLGIRLLRLVQEALANEAGTTFMFEINNRPIFCGGANWIPADSFTPRLSADRYRKWLRLAAEGNMVMLRVWGGGIYEEDVFYDTCDELGLMVWQDFMFACGLYPAHLSFQASVKAEAEAAVLRLRHHPSLVIWSGNNEDYAIAESTRVYDPSFEGDFTQSKFPARAIYEQLLPEVCARLDHTRPYWRGSPYGGKASSDPTTGDRHTWDVWHGGMADYHQYPKYEGRFVSEFGMQSMPELRLVETFAPESERTPYSRVMDFHNKAEGGQRRLAVYLADNLPVTGQLEEYIYATQFIQSEALAFALRGWRRRWGGPGHYAVAGALVWQLNDCWPVTSWAVVDYALTPKPAYYTLRREMAPAVLGLWDCKNGKAAFWGVTSLDAPLSAELLLTTWTLDGKELEESRQSVTLKPNQATEFGEMNFRNEDELVINAVLVSEGVVLARATLWPEPFKYLDLPDPEIEILRLPGDRLQMQSTRPAKGVFLTSEAKVAWSDNMLDLMPNEPQIITSHGLGSAEIKVQTLHSLYSRKKAAYA